MDFEPDPKVLSGHPITKRLLLACSVILLLAQVIGAGLLLLKMHSELQTARAETAEALRKGGEASERARVQGQAAEDERRIAAQRLENLVSDRKHLDEVVRAQRANLAAESEQRKAQTQLVQDLTQQNKVLSELTQKQAASDAKAADYRQQLADFKLRIEKAKEQVEDTTRKRDEAKKKVDQAEKRIIDVRTVVKPGTELVVSSPINANVTTKDKDGEFASPSVFDQGATVTVSEVTDARFQIVLNGRTSGWLSWSEFHKFFDTPNGGHK